MKTSWGVDFNLTVKKFTKLDFHTSQVNQANTCAWDKFH